MTMEEKKTIEYINIEEPKIIEVEVDEAFPAIGISNEELRHDILNNRDADDQHPTSAITGLDDTLKNLSSVRNIYAKSGGLAEFRRWSDDNPGSESRVGYFVAIVNNDGDIDICSKEHPDVYGVTVEQSGFCGYQNENYDYLNLDNNSINKADNWHYAKVCLVGDVKVRIDPYSGISVGDYVLPGNDGYAEKSTSGVGFRVSSMNNGKLMNGDGVETIAHFVTISLVPQNDNVARVMSELNTTNGNVDGIQVELGEIKDQISNIITDVGNDMDGIHSEMEGIGSQIDGVVGDLADVKSTFEEAENNTKVIIQEIQSTQANAISTAQSAAKDAKDALTQIEDLNYTITDQGTEIESLNTIKQLVARADKYNVGEYSLSYGLTYAEAVSILREGYIYVATNNHTENLVNTENNTTYTYDFVTFDESGYGTSYKWAELDGVYGWQYNSRLYTNAEEVPNGENGDLWYCWKNSFESYKEGTLYCHNGTEWVAVASIDDTARSIGYLRQTADELTSTYTALEGNVSTLTQTVNKMSTVVLNVDGEGSTLEQAADKIIAGTFNSEESSALALLLGYGFHAISDGKYHTLINTFSEDSNVAVYGNRYTQAPTWDEDLGKFVFVEDYASDEGKYYFHSEDQTRYCKETIDGYEIYGIGNIATSAIGQHISENQSAIDSWTKFKKGVNETGSIVSQESDESGASIASAVYGDFRECVDVVTKLSDNKVNEIESADKYINKPNYDSENEVFTFDDANPSEDGLYYLDSNDEGKFYRKALKNSEGKIIGYEKYGMKLSNYALLNQKVDNNGNAYIGLTAGNDNHIGNLFVSAINDRSEIGISADKISINGTAVFSDFFKPGTTTISGDYINSGVLVSNNYNGPTTYRKYGVKIKNGEIVKGDSDDFIYYAVVTEGASYSLLPIDGTYFKADTVKVGSEVEVVEFSSPATDSYYLVSNSSFDLTPSSMGSVQGIKLDLNEGTIFSKNFTLDKNGDIKLTGSISWDGLSPNEYTDEAITSLVNGTYPKGTFIDGKMIKSGLFFATGEGAFYNRNNESKDTAAYYICNGLSSKGTPQVVGYLSYDANGQNTEYENQNRVILTTISNTALKIQTQCWFDETANGGEGAMKAVNMSIGAGMHPDLQTYSGEGYVYFGSPVIFSEHGATFNANTTFKGIVNFENAIIEGLDTVAKFG
jgi:hypothetical protein